MNKFSLILILPAFAALAGHAQTAAPDTLMVKWDQTQMISKTALTLQVVVNLLNIVAIIFFLDFLLRLAPFAVDADMPRLLPGTGGLVFRF